MDATLRSEEEARRRDQDDPLSAFRKRFRFPRDAKGEPLVYLCGNSLGLQPRSAAGEVARELEDWAALAVEGHFKARRPWYSYHEHLAEGLARVVGARPGEVVAMNSLTVNLHLLMVSFFRPRGTRRKILVEQAAFPSDAYAAQSQLAHHGIDPAEGLVVLAPREGEATLRTEDVVACIEERAGELGLVLLPGVQYYTGQAFDITAITRAARAAGVPIGWDLAHAAGNLELALHEDGPDFAVWCSYKYLNAGPGAVAGAFVHERHGRRRDLQRLAGWWGNDPATRFEMHLIDRFEPQSGAAGWQLSNPPVLAMAPLSSSVGIFDEAGMAALRRRSLAMGDALLGELDRLGGRGVDVITPRDPAQRGCQLSLRVPGATRVLFERLRARGVVGDVRPPDVIRVAPAPLYNGYHDVWRFARILEESLSA